MLSHSAFSRPALAAFALLPAVVALHSGKPMPRSHIRIVCSRILPGLLALVLLLTLSACGTTGAGGPNQQYAGQPGYYTVQKGDTLSAVARKYRQSVASIAAWNALKDSNDIEVGQVLRVQRPGASSSAAATTAGSASAARKPAAAPEPQADEGPAPDSWVWPADGKQVASFSQNKKGIDIAGSAGQPVRAASDGKVSYVGNGIRGYGNLIIVKHSGGLLSVYAHNRAITAKEGQSVSKGQQIAEMGDSDSTSVKLYFEIRRQGKAVDPASYLPAR